MEDSMSSTQLRRRESRDSCVAISLSRWHLIRSALDSLQVHVTGFKKIDVKLWLNPFQSDPLVETSQGCILSVRRRAAHQVRIVAHQLQILHWWLRGENCRMKKIHITTTVENSRAGLCCEYINVGGFVYQSDRDKIQYECTVEYLTITPEKRIS